MYRVETNKDRKKLVRAIVEATVLILCAWTLFQAIFSTAAYQPYDEQDLNVVTGEDAGFVALSYFGVDRSGTNTLISIQQLEEQLQALRDCGYVTITQNDILEYYTQGKAIPEKALFLMFEDGRTDTAIFSQPILEKMNYIGTMCTYADKCEQRDPKFLSASDMKDLVDSSFWELGSNGYRLSYINVFDRYDRFLGEMTPDEFNSVNQYLGRNYNHYLMDYIRDANDVPVETFRQMQDRILYDYTLMEQIYSTEFGEIPQLYALMHANSDRFGNNEQVSEANEAGITELFKMNFNRESFSLNSSDHSIYDLTRMQVQAYWSTNHLLMRLWDDLDEAGKQNIQFVEGDADRSSSWNLLNGAAEFKDSSIILTSLPDGTGRLELANGQNQCEDVALEVNLEGTLMGKQSICLRTGASEQDGITIAVQEKNLAVYENGQLLTDVNLDELLGVTYTSVEEDKRDALVGVFTTRAKYASGFMESTAFRQKAESAKKMSAASVAQGAEAYIPEINLYDQGKWHLAVELVGDQLNVWVNGQLTVKNLTVATTEGSGICLDAAWNKDAYSQRNLSENVYDGIFNDLVIFALKDNQKEIIYDNRLQGMEKLWNTTEKAWNNLVNWFVVNL